MSLRKKIIISFFISAFIVGFLAIFVYVNFISIRNEMRFLEVTDSIRNRTLELRRHEKNFFLFEESADEEAENIRVYIGQLRTITEDVHARDPQKADELGELITTYEQDFNAVESGLTEMQAELAKLSTESPEFATAAPLVAVTVRDKPAAVAGFLQGQAGLADDHSLILKLNQLDAGIMRLRGTG